MDQRAKYQNNSYLNRSEGISIGDAIKKLINQYGIGEKLIEAKIISAWEEIVGKMIARHTQKLFVKKNKLYIQFDSAALKNEMLYARTKLLENVQNISESKLIDEIIFL